MSDPSPFHGLSAFPITPADEHGRVNVELLGRLLDRSCQAGVDSIGLLGSTGTYAYLSRSERLRAIEAAVECVQGRVPIVVGVGALRTDAARDLAGDAEAAGADTLLLAPVSYTPLTQDEVYDHFRVVAGASSLPLCVYNNPSTTHFTFGLDLLERLSGLPTVQAVKMPLPSNGNYGDEIATLRDRTGLAIGYSGDWGMTDALLAGADAFYSVLGGTLPAPVVTLANAVKAGDAAEARRIDATLEPLWDTFKAFGSLRVMYVLIDLLGLGKVELPLPIRPLAPDAHARVQAALEPLLKI